MAGRPLSGPRARDQPRSGNAGQTEALGPDDLGWILGRVHAMGKIPSRGLQSEIEWVVAGNGVVDVSENELEIWYGAQDRIIVRLNPPGSAEWIEVKPREFVENRRLADGTFVSIYNELYHPPTAATTSRSTSRPISAPIASWACRPASGECA